MFIFSGLIVRKGKPEVVIADLVKSLGIDTVSVVAFHEEVGLSTVIFHLLDQQKEFFTLFHIVQQTWTTT